MNIPKPGPCRAPLVTRRDFVERCALGVAALVGAPLLSAGDSGTGTMASGGDAATKILPLDGDWLFGGKITPADSALEFKPAAYVRITLPHSVVNQSWQNWNPADWQAIWSYRRHFTLPESFRGQRVFLHFDGVMVGVAPSLNGHALPTHLGGYLPFRYEVTEWVTNGENALTLAVDSRWSHAPPEGSPNGAADVDFLEVGGIHRSIRLEAVPAVFICDVFAKPVRVLGPDRRVDVTCSINAATSADAPTDIEVELRDGERLLARAQRSVRLEGTGITEVVLPLENLGDVRLWDTDSPNLYHVVTTLRAGGRPLHEHAVRIGFREARFTRDGFFLNGRRRQLRGLNRHEVYPYVGFAMPGRVMRRDAEILRRDFNCNIVRCSHYPQSPAFLDACDELGLMVWEETPGWQYLGDAAWKALVVRDVKDMILRDRNRPSVVIWGARVNESHNDVALYRQTRAVTKALDDSRPSSGSMAPWSRKNWERDWQEDVFAYDDYKAEPDGSVGLEEPVPNQPYLITEAVGQLDYADGKKFEAWYRRAGDVKLQQLQALRHAQAHNRAAANLRICGLIGWCGFDYASLIHPYHNVKCPGVADVFRIPKLGASFYLAQGDPKIRPVIAPNFYWDFGPQTPRGPGLHAAIFSNCERLEILVAGRHLATVRPDTVNFPHLEHPPFFTDLDCDGANRPELRIDGYVADRPVISRTFSSDTTQDRFTVSADDAELLGDGADATRLVFKVVDKFGAERAFGRGEVRFEVAGPGAIVGDNPFALADSGGVGAVWLKTTPNAAGKILVTAHHSVLGSQSVSIAVRSRPG